MGAEISLEPSYPGADYVLNQSDHPKMKAVISLTVAGGRSRKFQEAFIRQGWNFVKNMKNLLVSIFLHPFSKPIHGEQFPI